MSTATMQKQKEKTGSWSTVFPNEQVTCQQSALFVKKLLAVAISNIAYLRAIFPENAFGDRSLEDLHLKVLRDDSSCPGACQVIKWIKGCFDALEKQYLKTIVIGMYIDADNPESVIESYTFKFSYGGKGGMDVFRNDKYVAGTHSAAESKKDTMRLLRTIVVLTQTLHSLPDDVMMTMKLFYYDDVTPEDYEPPGFTAATASDNFIFEGEPLNIKVGDVSTMRVRTNAKQFEMVDEDGDAEIPLPEKVTDMSEGHQDMVIGDGPDNVQQYMPELAQPSEAGDAPNMTPGKPVAGSQESSEAQSEGVTLVVAGQDDTVNCPCGCNEDDGLMILCALCKRWQHSVCFAILKEEIAPERHICNFCGSSQDMPTDPSMLGLSEVAIQAQCLWRRALSVCTETKRIMQTTLSKRLGVEVTVASGLVNRLEKEGYLKTTPKDKRFGKLVDKEKLLNEAFPKYLTLEIQKEQPQTSDSLSKEDDNQSMKLVDQEMDSLASRTNDIVLSGQRGKRNISGKLVSDKKQQKKGKKRAKSTTTESEFDVSNSQDMSQEINYGDVSKPKKKKASIVQEAVLV